MDKEKLKELKELYEIMRSEADKKSMSTSDVDDVLELINAEIARQSVKSEEVQEAIEWVTDTRHGNLYMSGDWTAPMYNHINRTIQDTIITALQAYQPWIPVSERLPDKPEYDWVLVRIRLNPDGFYGLPHIAELRKGVWYSTEYEEPLQDVLNGTVTYWKPLPPKGE